MEMQVDCEPESDGCNFREDQSSDFYSISDWVGHKASPPLKVKEDNFIPKELNLTPSCLSRSSDKLSCHIDFSTKPLCGQEKIPSTAFPKTSTYWRQQNPPTPGVYVPVRIIYNPSSEGKDPEHQCFEHSKDPQGQREEENFIILVDSNEDENIPPQLGQTLPCHYKKCRKSFQDLTRLQEHRKLHMAENSYWCPLCGKEFFRAANLRMHKLTHTKEKPHKCPICNKGFIRTADVWRHLRSFHKVERSGVLGNANLRNQWRTPKKSQDNKQNPKELGSVASNLGKESSKQYLCPVCSKAFSKSNLLSKHKVIHRQEKPYECKECGMAFVQLARLKRHNLTHTGERPFSCERCNATFTRLGSLQRHQRIHTGEKPYSCSYCSVSFADSGTLRRHEETHKVIQT